MPALKRILIFEDDACSVKLLQARICNEWPDCVVIHASDRTGYMEALDSGAFDVILSDYLIPHFSGLQALSVALIKCPETPFLLISGVMSDEMALESLKAGAVDYILKDRPARLIPAIHRALDLAEAKCRQVEHEKLVNSVDGIVWQAEHPSLKFIFVSQQAERILGYPIKSWLEEPDFWQNHIHPEDVKMAVNLCQRLTSGHKHLDFEYRMVAADGRVVWLRDMVSVRIKKNSPLRIQGIMMDITSHRAAEEKIKEVQLQLEEANKDLVRRNQEIQSFYHVLSHELKTPLTSAREFISMVVEGIAGPLNKSQQEYLGIAKDSCNQLRVCVNDLLDTTRIETGKLSLQFDSLNLVECLQRLVMAMNSKAVDHNVQLVFEPQPDLPDITADESRITQIITNLIDNAIKFSPSGGKVAINVSESSSRPDFIQVSVHDSGRGIPKGEEERIFERLHQIKSGDAISERGIGMGLYLCRELVWLHGGVIWVNSEAGKGSTFTFMLPKSQKRMQPSILVMDDDIDLLEMTKMALSTEYDVRTAIDGAEGIKEMSKKLPDIVIMDLAMPGMDGVDALKIIRKNWDAMPVIVYTAYSNGNIMKRAMEYSPFTLLSKPSEVNSLLRTVRCVRLGIHKDLGEDTSMMDHSPACDSPLMKIPISMEQAPQNVVQVVDFQNTSHNGKHAK